MPRRPLADIPESAVERMLSEDIASGGYSKEIFDLTVLELWHRQFLDKAQPQSSPGPSCYPQRAQQPDHFATDAKP